MKQVLVALAVMAGSVQAQEGEKGKVEGATVAGQVRITVVVPKSKKVPMDPQCTLLHGEPPVSDETVVDAENNVKGAFVWIKKGLEGRIYPVPREKVLLDQVGCMYKPRVFGIRVGQTLLIRNSDPTGHNVNALAFDNKPFNIGQPLKGQENEVQFTKPEVMLKVVCNIHGWMSTHAGVVDHPFFAVTDDAGKFTLKGLPPGKYTIAAWHERWTTTKEKGWEQEFEVKAGETRTVNFALDKKKV